MKVYPSSAEGKLGFDVLRARLAGYTRSRLGEERVERMRPAGSLGWLQRELARVAELQQAFRFDDAVPLDDVLDLREVFSRVAIEGALVGPEDLLAIRLSLITVRRVKSYFVARREKYPALAESVAPMVPLPEVERLIAGIVDDEGAVRDNASPELRRLRRAIVQRREQLRAALQRALRDAIASGHATEEQPTIRNGRMVIPIRAEAKRKVQGFVQDTSATGQTVYIEPAAALDLNNEVREMEGEERREVERILREVTGRLREHLDAFRENVRAISAFDLLQAKARLANELDAVVPVLNDDGVIAIKGGRNPVLQLHFNRRNAAASAATPDEAPRAVIPLDLTLGDDFRTLVITGPNAGGKSVALKTVGLFALMLGYGLPLPLDETSRFSFFDRILVDIGDEQSIEEDLSTFSSHVANLKHMLRVADDRTLVLIDEAGTGTDPAEGGALAQAVLERLTAIGARTIVTTHHGTLKAFAHEAAGVENGSMQFDQDTLSPTYRFQARIPGSSYAFEIARRMGLHTDTLDRARALVGEQKTALEELIATFEARTQSLAEKLVVAEKALKEAEAERAQYEERRTTLRDETDNIRRQAALEAERLLGEANARIERTIREIKEAEAAKEATKDAREELESFKTTVKKRKEKVERRQEKRRKKARAPKPAGNGQPASSKPSKSAPGGGASAARGPLAVGDQVVLDDGGTAAEVLELDDREVVIAVGQMRMRVKRSRVTKVGGPRRQQVTVRQTATSSGDLSAMTARTEVDLRGQRVDEALAEVMRLIDEATAANFDRVEILHGKGTGALRQAIHEYLSARPDVAAFDDAAWNQGGAGVTVVTLR